MIKDPSNVHFLSDSINTQYDFPSCLQGGHHTSLHHTQTELHLAEEKTLVVYSAYILFLLFFFLKLGNVIAFYHCDKIPKIINLMEKSFILAHGFRDFSKS